MKKISQVIVLLLGIWFTLGAQVPQFFNYQATLRDNAGQLLVSKSVSLRISILQNSTSGIAVFSETHQTTTTNIGIINVQIGKGSSSNNLDNIDWTQGPYFVKIEVDQNGGNNYVALGTSELTSVPYALLAKNAEAINWENVTNKPELFNGNYNDLTNQPALFDGTWENLENKPALATVATSGSYADLLDKPVIPTNTNQLTNGAGFITTSNETDPIFTSSPAKQITNGNISNWNTAYGWGNHALAGYAKYPSQSGNSGKFLLTNGASTAWAYAINSANPPLYINNNLIGIAQASSTSNGYLSSSDWNTFNNKAPSPWIINGSSIYYNDGNVGIGRNTFESYYNPKLWLHNGWLQVSDSSDHDAGIVVSHLNKTGYGYARTVHQVFEGVNGDPFTEFRIRSNNDDFTLTSWSVGADNDDEDKFKINLRANHSSGSSPSYGENILTLTTAGNMGIGTSEPLAKLNIVGNVDEGDERSFIRLKNNSTGPKATVSIALQSFENKGVALGYVSSTNSMNDLADFGAITTNGRGLAFVANYGQIRFFTNKNVDNTYSEKMRINEEGNVGIGTTTPNARLEIADGDVYIKDINKGIIMTSPDGQCWRGTINNSGVLEFVAVECP